MRYITEGSNQPLDFAQVEVMNIAYLGTRSNLPAFPNPYVFFFLIKDPYKNWYLTADDN